MYFCKYTKFGRKHSRGNYIVLVDGVANVTHYSTNDLAMTLGRKLCPMVPFQKKTVLHIANVLDLIKNHAPMCSLCLGSSIKKNFIPLGQIFWVSAYLPMFIIFQLRLSNVIMHLLKNKEHGQIGYL